MGDGLNNHFPSRQIEVLQVFIEITKRFEFSKRHIGSQILNYAILHHRETEHIYTEGPRENLQPIPHLLPLMLLVLPRELIDSTQKSTSHVPIDAKYNLNLTR